jgi:4-hydroxy-tetrahydrodipicolinate synthase
MSDPRPGDFAGVHTALVTPFTADASAVDIPALEAQVLFQASGGVAGVVACGTTGETPTLGTEERRAVIRSVAATAGPLGLSVVVGAGSNSTVAAIEFSAEAEDLGATATLQVVPYYNRPSQEGLFRHFSSLADSARIPIVLYDVPGRTGVGLASDTVVRLAGHERIVAIKVANGSIGYVSELAQRCDLAILSGDDPLTLPMQSVGAIGAVSVVSNIAPGEVVRQVAAANRGDFAAARPIHERLFGLSSGLFGLDGNPVPVKAAMAILGRDTGVVRPPLAAADESTRRAVAELLGSAGIEGVAGGVATSRSAGLR